MTSKTGLHYLILKIASGDKSAYEELAMTSRMPLTEYVAGRFGSRFSDEDIEEIVDQSILNIFLHTEEYHGDHGEKSAWGWAYQISCNQALKWIRTTKREIHLSAGDDCGTDLEEDQLSRMMIRCNPGLEAEGIEDQLEEKLLIEKLVEIIQGLSPQERLILRLHFVMDWHWNEIAATIGVKPPRITQIMKRIMHKCYSQLAVAGFDSL
ncbi:sigma-70 family RNA polymerase sigma factor [bacterium]|nr:MAG: sigma-70 family RNA polymerase sigma factor [bacterium]